MMNNRNWLGVDFGAKMAGTTAICFKNNQNLLVLKQSAKKEDADKFLQQHITIVKPTHIFIDAPLSLPAVYRNKGTDYFFRECDTLVNAMSPMFIGGLTARAIKMKETNNDIQFMESYPSFLAKKILNTNFPEYRKDNITDIYNKNLEKISGLQLQLPVACYHQLDAVLCWLIGMRYFNGQAISYGNPDEGVIWV